jgi:hypothetical protein
VQKFYAEFDPLKVDGICTQSFTKIKYNNDSGLNRAAGLKAHAIRKYTYMKQELSVYSLSIVLCGKKCSQGLEYTF